jgi:hypothetical protein
VAAAGRRVLADELAERLAALGAAAAPLIPTADAAPTFHWGRWFTTAARTALEDAAAIGYAGAGALALVGDDLLRTLLAAGPGEVVTNNRYSADAFVVAAGEGMLSPDAALVALEGCPTDNAAARCLEAAGFASRDLAAMPWSRFDVDTPMDLALLRLATRLPSVRALEPSVARFVETAALPDGRTMEVPRLGEIGAVIRSRDAELVVAGRVPSSAWSYLETESACRVRCFIEERGMRAEADGHPRSLLAEWARRLGPADLVRQLAELGDAVILDTRVLMAASSGSSSAASWPPEEERFASDFGDAIPITTAWLAELTRAAASSRVPFLLGGHALVSDGLRILVDTAWLGR